VISYEELDLCGGIEDVEYGIAYGVRKNNEAKSGDCSISIF
jgi:hypothetical protein